MKRGTFHPIVATSSVLTYQHDYPPYVQWDHGLSYNSLGVISSKCELVPERFDKMKKRIDDGSWNFSYSIDESL